MTSTGAITVIGEMLVDQFDSGPVVGGAPFNVARHLAAFGHGPMMLSAVGADANGQLLLGEMDRYGMSTAGIQRTSRHPTGVVEVQMDSAGSHRFVISDECAWDHIELEPAHSALTAFNSSGWLYAGTLALRSPTSRTTQLALMRSHRGSRYLDINWREGHVERDTALQAVRLADVLKVNEDELAMLCRWCGAAPPESLTPAALADAARELFGRLGIGLLLVTLGPAGAMAVDRHGVTQAKSQTPVRLIDTVGAGDSFSAVVITGRLRGWDMRTTLERATEFAGRICEVRGAVPADLNLYAAWTASW
jgi:fructokinase